MQNFMPTSLCGIILDSTFGSIYDLAVDKCEAILPFGAEMAISSLMGRNIPEISLDKFVAPKLIIHSFLDPVVPFSHGNNLHERLPQPKKLIPTSANGHIEFFANKNTKQWQVFEVWLSSLSLMS